MVISRKLNILVSEYRIIFLKKKEKEKKRGVLDKHKHFNCDGAINYVEMHLVVPVWVSVELFFLYLFIYFFMHLMF